MNLKIISQPGPYKSLPQESRQAAKWGKTRDKRADIRSLVYLANTQPAPPQAAKLQRRLDFYSVRTKWDGRVSSVEITALQNHAESSAIRR